MLTGLRMHAKGWKSLFVNERLVAAMAAEDITSFNTQRLRWGEGNLAIFAIDNPLTMKGLTWAQRLCYLGSMLSWTTGVQKLLIYFTPMLMLLTDIPPVNKMTWQLALLIGVYLAAVWTGVKIASNGYGWLLAIELTQMTCFWTQVRSTWRAIFNRPKSQVCRDFETWPAIEAAFSGISRRRSFTSPVGRDCHQLGDYALSIEPIPGPGRSDDRLGVVDRQFVSGMGRDSPGALAPRIVVPRGATRLRCTSTIARSPLTATSLTGQCVTRDINEGGLGLVAFDQFPTMPNSN